MPESGAAGDGRQGQFGFDEQLFDPVYRGSHLVTSNTMSLSTSRSRSRGARCTGRV